MKPTQEQVIAWAREAGYEFNSLGATYTSGRLADLLNSFATLAYEAGRKDENEACVALIQANAEACDDGSVLQVYLASNAAAIRARVKS